MIRFDAACEKVKNILYRYRSIFRYAIYSVIVTIIDGSIVYLLLGNLSINIIIANTVGVVAGFLIHYCISIENVFAMKPDKIVFFVYLGTFLIGLVLADYIIWLSYEVIKFGFLASKGASIVIPFFAIYGTRKAIYRKMKKEI